MTWLYRSVGIYMLLVIITQKTLGDVLIVANLGPPGIYTSDISLDNDTVLNFTVAIPTDLTRPVALEYDPYTSTLYWSDVTKETIESYSLVDNDHHILVSSESGAVDGIAVDGIGQKLYWTSTAEDRIEVINLDGTERTILFDTGLTEPRAIELDSTNRYLYWTDWGTQMIERANLDDLSTRTPLITTGLFWPNGLVLAVPDGKMYWCDAGNDIIEEANLDGSSRRTIIDTSILHPFDLDIYGNFLYVTDWTSGGVYRVNRLNGLMSVESTDSRLNQPGGIYIKKDFCSRQCQNGGQCVIQDGIESCVCMYGFMGTTCQKTVVYCPCT